MMDSTVHTEQPHTIEEYQELVLRLQNVVKTQYIEILQLRAQLAGIQLSMAPRVGLVQ